MTATARRAFPVLLAVALMGLSPLQEAASAAAGRRTVVAACPSGDPACWPTAFAFTPDGRKLFYLRLGGEVRVHDLRTGADRRWLTIRRVALGWETGALGIAVDPRWPTVRWIYVLFTRNAQPDRNEVVRYRKLADGSVDADHVFEMRAGETHNGGVIHFGPDGMLYIVTGDRGAPGSAQRVTSPAGKILRIMPWGGVPPDNPYGNRVFSYGHRNSFGFAFDPWTRLLWQSENGRNCDDEVNLVRIGANHGWGSASFLEGDDCAGDTSQDGENPVQPAWTFNPVIAPTGAAFCDRCGLEAAHGRLLVGSWLDGAIRRLTLAPGRTGVAAPPDVLFSNGQPVLAVEAHPGGRIYFSDPTGIHELVGA